MTILIDGYNLLNAAGTEGVGGGTALEQARRGLLEFLAAALDEEEAAATTIVFDAAKAPPGLPHQESYRGILILYSKGYREADDLIEELIAADHAPRKLVVVSSDHRLHRAARRRRATAKDSDVWLGELRLRRRASGNHAQRGKTDASPESIQHWLREFADVDVDAIESSTNLPQGETEQSAADGSTKEDEKIQRRPPVKEGFDEDQLDDWSDVFPAEYIEGCEEVDEIDNPFPPGYGEDLAEGDSLA